MQQEQKQQQQLQTEIEAKHANNQPVDVLRDTYWRYLGYANELGECARPLVRPLFVHGSYAIAGAYVFADALSKSHKNYNDTHASSSDTWRWHKAIFTSMDVVSWQLAASVIIPGFTINRIVKVSSLLLQRSLRTRKIPLTPFLQNTVRFAPSAIGLASIPFIIHPIDHGVTVAMDYARPLLSDTAFQFVCPAHSKEPTFSDEIPVPGEAPEKR
jgi:fission process protein 1